MEQVHKREFVAGKAEAHEKLQSLNTRSSRGALNKIIIRYLPPVFVQPEEGKT
jgi:hypothetical protein